MIYELEVRLYGLFCSDLFISFLRKKYQDHLTDKISDTVYSFSDRVRYIQSDDSVSLQKMEKFTLYEKRLTDRKFSVSTEAPTQKTDFKLKNAENVRNRYREVYTLDSGIEMHITKINNLSYEVEVEQEIDLSEEDWDENNESILDSFQNKFDTFFEEINLYARHLNTFLKVFNDVDRHPDKHHRSKIPIGTMSRNVIAKPRDIEKEDFITEKGKGLPEGYTLTIKGNGIPIILYFKKRYLFFIIPYVSFTLMKELKQDFQEEFMIIGEYIDKKSSKSSIFAPFDILHWSRHKDIRNHPNHLERLDIAFDILNRNSKDIIGDSLHVFRKDFIPIGKTPSSFAKAYMKIKDKSYPFGNDGMILTPIYHPQNVPLPREAKGKQQLSKWPEVCKIKPWNELSVDFVVDIEKKEVYTSCETKPYKGSFKFPFDAKSVIDWSSIPPEMNNKIVELYPVRMTSTEDQISDPNKSESDLNFVLRFSRERTDKDEPNHQSTVDRVWAKIRDPLEERVFLAKDLSRLRFQNNRIKKMLIGTIPKKSIVIDIGTGFGGDIFKYNNIADIVICIEPIDRNRTELLNRLRIAKSSLKTRFEVLSCGGEDTETIMEAFKPIRNSLPDAQVVVSSMLSLTFFWKNAAYLDLFKNTLKSISKYSNGALFYFYTIEGNRFKKYLEENDNKIKNSAFRASYDSSATEYGVGIPGRLKIEIYDTIVSLQREYLVDLTDLNDVLTDVVIKDGKIENYLTEDESNYAHCHVYGTAKIV